MNNRNCFGAALLQRKPQAVAVMNGSSDYPELHGIVRFYQAQDGTLVYAELSGLPYSDRPCEQQIFGFHIHGGESCTGTADAPFADAGTHYNPESCAHPFHAGDLPPLFGNHGRAITVFLTNRFTIGDILGKAIIIHGSRDDFTTQPGGDAGVKIACGIVMPVARR